MNGLAGRTSSTSSRGQTRTRTEPETTGETGDGVWAIFTVDDEGGAHIEEVYPTELDALRANKNNTDPTRKVRFLPYGIAVSVLDATDRRRRRLAHSKFWRMPASMAMCALTASRIVIAAKAPRRLDPHVLGDARSGGDRLEHHSRCAVAPGGTDATRPSRLPCRHMQPCDIADP